MLHLINFIFVVERHRDAVTQFSISADSQYLGKNNRVTRYRGLTKGNS